MFELSNNILFHLLVLPLIGALVLLALPSWNASLLRITALFFSMLTFVYSLFLWVWFDKSTSQFQFIQEIVWVPSLNLNFTLGIDGISLFLVILTTLLIPLCILASWVGIKNNVKEYLIAFLVMESFLIGVFCVLDLLLFYVLRAVHPPGWAGSNANIQKQMQNSKIKPAKTTQQTQHSKSKPANAKQQKQNNKSNHVY